MSEERSFGKKGGVFLVLVDGTEELMTAIDYASQFAKAQKLIIQDGAGSDIITNVRVGSNFIISGSI